MWSGMGIYRKENRFSSSRLQSKEKKTQFAGEYGLENASVRLKWRKMKSRPFLYFCSVFPHALYPTPTLFPTASSALTSQTTKGAEIEPIRATAEDDPMPTFLGGTSKISCYEFSRFT